MENTATINRMISVKQTASVKAPVNVQSYRFITPLKPAAKIEVSETEKEIQMARLAAFNRSFGNGSY